jgi:RNA polymerase sigma-70 factor (ECF subfamily)
MPDLDDQLRDKFASHFAAHGPALRTFVRALLPSSSDASEVTQRVAVLLWRKFAEFDESRDFRKWAFGVARYEVLGFLRDRSRDRHVFNVDLVNQLADDADRAGPRHEAQREALETCLKKLPESRRALVLAAYAKGIRMDELAAQRGQSAMSLYKVLHRVRQSLLECVQHALVRESLL